MVLGLRFRIFGQNRKVLNLMYWEIRRCVKDYSVNPFAFSAKDCSVKPDLRFFRRKRPKEKNAIKFSASFF